MRQNVRSFRSSSLHTAHRRGVRKARVQGLGSRARKRWVQMRGNRHSPLWPFRREPWPSGHGEEDVEERAFRPGGGSAPEYWGYACGACSSINKRPRAKAHFFEPSVRGLKASAPSVLNNGAETTLGSLAKTGLSPSVSSGALDPKPWTLALSSTPLAPYLSSAHRVPAASTPHAAIDSAAPSP